MGSKMITLQFSEEDATHLESFLQHLQSTYVYPIQRPVAQDMKAVNGLYTKLKKALDVLNSK